ncbi:hypothetical protein NAPIS_ORF02300 [Vairimorpha apis BRL 01]|uniref:Uncharacterized protein n=1 Tax=Vairimorpha apis BRL 01 TaxID=1037528 RepID=T0L610_9MICR|nr:hypothetical protein NAPIS_ORF02300 [Vairimorpha apis BRL 01]
MSTESIKKLVQFENEAKELLTEAYKKYDDMKKQAHDDAMEVVMVEKELKFEELVALDEQLKNDIIEEENKKKSEFENKIKNLDNIQNKYDIINELVKKISLT